MSKIELTDDELELARITLEDELISRRDSNISVMRNNGLSVKNRDGSFNDLIRIGTVEAFEIAMKAINKSRGFEG